MAKHDETLKAIFKKPPPSDLTWNEIESLLVHLGAKIRQGRGSRLRIALNGVKTVFHKPHEKDTDKGAVNSMKKFLESAGVTP